MDNSNNTNKKFHMIKHLRAKLIGLAVAIAVCVLGGVAIGKYLTTRKDGGEVDAKWFYFTSDLLKEYDLPAGTTKIKEYDLPAGTDTIKFTVGNYADDLRISDVDVMYKFEITATDKNGDEVIDNTVSADKDNIKDLSMPKTIYTNDTITLSNLKNGVNYTVTATGYSKGTAENPAGYITTLKATFKVAEGLLYKHLDVVDNANTGNKGCYVLLTVWSEGYQGDDIKIDFNDSNNSKCTLIPDNTDSVMSSATTDGKVEDKESFCDNEYSSHTYRFFVKDGDYSKLTDDNFYVTYCYVKDDEGKETYKLAEPSNSLTNQE